MTSTATVSEWLSVVRRARLGRTVKGIAYALATRTNNDGTRLFTGIARLSVECEVTPKVMKQALRTLREVGLIDLVRASRTLGETNEYRLTIPADGRLVVPTPAAHDLEIARVSASVRGKWKTLRGTDDPAGNTDLRGSGDTAGDGDDPKPAGYGEDTKPAPAGYGEDDLRGTAYPALSPLPRQSTTTSPNTGDIRTDAEVVGDPTPDQDPDFSDEKKPRLRLVTSRGGFGFCMACYADGKTTLAADTVTGSACDFHLRQEAS